MDAAERFEAWLRTPIPSEGRDAEFEVRRARPAEYERIYTLVDDAFGVRRSRDQYDWLYRRNPLGPARCWIAIHRSSGRLVSSEARTPWPVVCDGERTEACVVADSVTAEGWRRRGVYDLRRRLRNAHPWEAGVVSLAFPNAASRAAMARGGRNSFFMGPLPRWLHVLDGARALRRAGVAPRAAGTLGAVADRLQGLRARLLSARPNEIRIEPVHRFDSSFDELVARCTPAEGYACTRSAELLNWRYFDHKERSYRAFAALDAMRLTGFAVLGVSGDRATLMEMTVLPGRADAARALLDRVAEEARAAGCWGLEFFGGPRWPWWTLLPRAGFVRVRAHMVASAHCLSHPGASSLERWHLVPGDSESL